MCWSRYIMCLQSRLAHRLGTGYIQPPSQHVSRDISCTFRAGQPTDWGTGYIHPPFRMGGLRYITCFQNGWAEIYHMPSERVGRDISTPLHSRSAEIYHMPSERVGQDISTPLPSGLAGIYHMPSERVG